jgi:hypothetical protein
MIRIEILQNSTTLLPKLSGYFKQFQFSSCPKSTNEQNQNRNR